MNPIQETIEYLEERIALMTATRENLMDIMGEADQPVRVVPVPTPEPVRAVWRKALKTVSADKPAKAPRKTRQIRAGSKAAELKALTDSTDDITAQWLCDKTKGRYSLKQCADWLCQRKLAGWFEIKGRGVYRKTLGYPADANQLLRSIHAEIDAKNPTAEDAQ